MNEEITTHGASSLGLAVDGREVFLCDDCEGLWYVAWKPTEAYQEGPEAIIEGDQEADHIFHQGPLCNPETDKPTYFLFESLADRLFGDDPFEEEDSYGEGN